MRKFKMKVRKGFALIFVIIIALAMIIPALILASSAIPRRTAVTGEAISDRVLAVADATVDKVLTTINTFPFTLEMPKIIVPLDPDVPDGEVDEELIKAQLKAQNYLISYYLSQLNGGVPDINNPITSYDQISGYVSTYLFNLQTQEYFAVWDTVNNNIAHINTTGPDGDIKTGQIKNLTTGALTTIDSVDSDYKTNNLWIEIDTNTQYWPGEPDKWVIKTTSYLLSKPEIKRTIEAIASRGEPNSTGDVLANGIWYFISPEGVPMFFSDFAGLYHTKVYFGRFETTRGMIRGDSDVYMGGWAEDQVYATGQVYDTAIDHNWAHDGRFGPDKLNLAWAKANGYANYIEAADWGNGDLALKGSQVTRNVVDPNGGLQDKAGDDYYVNGNATIVFSVDVNGVGWVTINGNKLEMPFNGAIYVEGNATVSGKVKGRATVGAGGNINIGGNIVYDTPPDVDHINTPLVPPDCLGLIAYSNIVIPTATFNANHHLQIDAAMLTVHGWFGIDSSAPWHTINGSGEYEAYWNGCQAVWSMSRAPAMVSGSSVQGYEIQHTYFDWNLYNYGPPPFYPITKTGQKWIDKFVPVTNSTIKNYLQQLKRKDLSKNNDPETSLQYPYIYVYDGITYYYGDKFNIEASASMQKTALYRITWKEQIAEPVKP